MLSLWVYIEKITFHDKQAKIFSLLQNLSLKTTFEQFEQAFRDSIHLELCWDVLEASGDIIFIY